MKDLVVPLLQLAVAVVFVSLQPVSGAWPGEESPGVAEAMKVRAIPIDLLAVRLSTNEPVAELDASSLIVRFDGSDVPFRLRPAGHRSVEGGDDSPARLTLQIGSEEHVSESTPDRPRHYLFLLDLGSLPRGKPGENSEALIRFVTETMRPFDRGAVAIYNGGLRFEAGYGSSISEIVDAIRKASTRARTPELTTQQRIRSLISNVERCERVTGANTVLSAEETRMERASTFGSVQVEPGCLRTLASVYVDESVNRAVRFFSSLERAIRFSGGVDGMTVFAVTGGVSLDPDREFEGVATSVMGQGQFNEIRGTLRGAGMARDAMGRTLALAERDGVRLNFVDPTRDGRGAQGARQASLSFDASDPYSLAAELPRGPLQELARTTGGSFLRDRDIYGGLVKVRNHESGMYELLVYAPEDATDVDLRDLDVRTKDGDTRLTYDRAAGRVADDDEIHARLSLGAARIVSPKDTDTLFYLPFTVGASPGELEYTMASDGRSANLSLYVRVERISGGHVVSSYHSFRHSIPTEIWETQKDRLLGIRGWMEVPPGQYRLSTVLRNADSGRQGIVSKGIVLQEPARAPAGDDPS